MTTDEKPTEAERLHTHNPAANIDETVTWCGKHAEDADHIAFGNGVPPERGWFMRGPDLDACRECRDAWERAHRQLTVKAYDIAYKKIADAVFEMVTPILGTDWDVWGNCAMQAAENVIDSVCRDNNISIADGDLGCVEAPKAAP